MIVHPDTIVVICSCCKRVKLTDTIWIKAALPADVTLSHGLCPRCYRIAVTRLEGYRIGGDL
jgi:hypothetical protein